MKNFIIFLVVIIGFPLATNATTYRNAYPYSINFSKQNIEIKAVPYAPRDGSPMYGKTVIYKNNKKIYSIDKYFREQIFPSENGKMIVIVRPNISRYLRDGSKPIIYNDEVITILKNGKPFLEYELRQLIDVNLLDKIDDKYSFNWTFNHNPYESWFTRFKAKRTERNNIFISNNILHIATITNSIVRINLENGEKIEDLNLENSLPIRKKFKAIKKKLKIQKIKYPEKLTLPVLDNGKSFNSELSNFLKMELTNYSPDKERTTTVHIHTLLLNKEGKCDVVYINSGSKILDTKILNWIKKKKFETHEIPSSFDKYKFEGIVYLNK